MIDVLPKLYLLSQSSILWDKIDYWLFNSLQNSFCQDTLVYLGIPKDRILEVSSHTHLQSKNLICTSPPCITNEGRFLFSSWIIDFLQNTFLTTPNFSESKSLISSQRIWISRLDSSRRSIANEQDVINFLRSFGFTSVTLSSLSVKEQAHLFCQAEVIIAPHGAGLANLVFCKPGTKILEIFLPPNLRGQWSGTGDYCNLSNQLGLPYFYMVSDELPEFKYEDNWNRHRMHIDLQKLLALLKLAGVISSPY